MNGNFELDRGAYPYGGVTLGDGILLHNIQTLEPVVKISLPRPVVDEAALHLNTLYYGGVDNRIRLKSVLLYPHALIHTAASLCHERGTISSTAYQAVLTALKGL